MMTRTMKRKESGGGKSEGAIGEVRVILFILAVASYMNVHVEREREEEEALEEDDLDLLEENTGASFKHRLTRLRRAPGSPSARSSGKRKAVVESSDDDLDNDDLELPKVQDIHNIWDDERGGGRDDEDDADMDDLDNFIDDEDEDEQGVVMDEEEREERRRERRRLEKERRKAMGSRPELSGIDAKYVLLYLHGLFDNSWYTVLGTRFTKCSATGTTMIGLWLMMMRLPLKMRCRSRR